MTKPFGNELQYDDPNFYTGESRSRFEIVDKVKVNSLPTLESVKDMYFVHLFSDGYIGVYNTQRKTYLKPIIGDKRSPYFRYGLRTIENKSKTTYMHRLVGLAWVDGWEKGKVIDHKNVNFHSDPKKNQLDNVVENLEWIEPELNTKRAVEDGLGVGRPRVAKIEKPKLTTLERSQVSSRGLDYDQVSKIFQMANEGYTVSQIAQEMDVTQACISMVLSGKRWGEHPARRLYLSKKIG